MYQGITVLITRQDELSNIYGARSQELTYLKNPVTLFATTNGRLNGRLEGILKLIEKQFLEPKKHNGDRETTIGIRSLRIDRATEIVVFSFVQRFTQTLPVPTEQYVTLGSPALVKLKDLQWTIQEKEESYRRHFLSTFARYNEKLRALENYCAAKTPRYTIIQNRLLPCIKITGEKRDRPSNDDTERFNQLKELQTFHIVLTEERSNSSAETRREIDAESTLSEVERLRNENELLGLALRKSAEEQKALEEYRQGLEQREFDLETNEQQLENHYEAVAISLSEKERFLEEQRGCLEKDRQDLLAQRETVRQRETENREEDRRRCRVLEEERAELGRYRQDLVRQREDVSNREAALAADRQSWEREKSALRSDLDQRERNIRQEDGNRRRVLEQERAELGRNQQDLERRRRDLSNREAALAAERESWEREKSYSISELNMRGRNLQEEYSHRFHVLGEERAELRRNERDLERRGERLSEREADYEARMSRLRERERTVEREREELKEKKRKSKSDGGGSSSSRRSRSRSKSPIGWMGLYNPWSESDWPYYCDSPY